MSGATTKTGSGRFFEDFRLGETIVHATPRTVTGGDVALYTALYGPRFAVQSSDVFARAVGYPAAPVDDLLVFHIVFGKTVPDISLNAVANLGYDERRRMNEAGKAAIAGAAAAAIPDNSSLILNIGTTTEAVARALLGHRNLTVVTNNMNVANILASNPSSEVVVAGGVLRRSDGGLVGELTTHVFEQFKVDIAVIGCSALDEEGDILDFDLAEVRVSKAILRQARRAFLVADASKLGRPAPARLASLCEIDALFTDAPLPETLAERCRAWDTDVVVAAPAL